MKRLIILAFIFVFTVLLSVVFISKKEKLDPSEIPSKIPSIRREVNKLIASKGPRNAYEEIKKRYKNKDFFIQHAAVHIFGEVVYEKEGKGAIAYCDSDFSFGCYHAVFSHSVRDEGLGVIKGWKEYCSGFESKLEKIGCQHGLGHGIGEFLGPQNIVQGLTLCEDLVSTQRPFGCFGGVLMEYNFPSLFSGEGGEIRQLTKDNIYDPCVSLTARYQPSCFYRLPEWWEVVLERDYTQMGELCRNLNNVGNRKYCFMGMGATISDTKLYSKEETISSCKEAGKDGFDLCVAGADFTSFMSDNHEKGYFCEGEDVNKQECNSEASQLESTWGI